MVTFALVILLILVGYHARLEWKENLAGYLCRVVHLNDCPRWLAPALSGLAVGILAIPLVAAMLLGEESAWRACALAFAAGGFLGDIFSTHIIPTWVTGQRSPAFSTWWMYLLAGTGLILYIFIGLDPTAGLTLWVLLGIVAFVSLWPGMFLLRAATPAIAH